jgi:hypothetical protein
MELPRQAYTWVVERGAWKVVWCWPCFQLLLCRNMCRNLLQLAAEIATNTVKSELLKLLK